MKAITDNTQCHLAQTNSKKELTSFEDTQSWVVLPWAAQPSWGDVLGDRSGEGSVQELPPRCKAVAALEPFSIGPTRRGFGHHRH